MKKLILIIITLFTSLGIVNAWVVPGTIQKGNYESNIFCTTKTESYSPTWWSYTCSSYNNARHPDCWAETYKICATSDCWVKNYTACWYANDDLTKTTVCATWSTCSYSGYTTTSCTTNYNSCAAYACWAASYKSCRTSANGCEKYLSSPTWTDSYTNYTEKSGMFYFSQSSNSIKLKNDETQSCDAKATVNVTHTPPSNWTWNCPVWNCAPSSIPIKNQGTWKNAQCTTWYSRDNLVISFDQLWNIWRQYTNYQNKQSCKVEWRYATQDTAWPLSSINLVQNVFSNDDNKWCNIAKYRAWTITEWCKYFRDRVSGRSWNDDLLKWLEITIWNDVSWIWKVNIILWACNGSYTPDTTTLSSILNSTTAASWVKSQYTNWFIIKYNSNFTALNKTQPSLLNLFWKTRLDECLDEWKNLLIVKTEDLARSDSNWVSTSPNWAITQIFRSINIDTSASETKTTWDFLTSQNTWKNYTLKWNIEQWEVYKSNKISSCNTLSWALIQCSWTLFWWQIWVAPSWINPSTWKFTSYICDWKPWRPSTTECKMWCPNWQTWNPNLNKCEWTATVCKAFVGWAEVAIENWVNWVVTWPTCMAYCIPGHSLNCVVKGDNI